MVTPIQLARAYSVIANGGYLVKPFIVEKAVLPDGKIYYEHKEESFPRVIQPETAEIIRTLCHQVVLKATGKTANIPEYKVGGKTGTAHLARTVKEGGGYDPDKIIPFLTGFAPVIFQKLLWLS
jgi:cell division protein FtsI/penicillin-binding protein 2